MTNYNIDFIDIINNIFYPGFTGYTDWNNVKPQIPVYSDDILDSNNLKRNKKDNAMIWGLVSMGIVVFISIITYMIYRYHVHHHQKAKREIANLFSDLNVYVNTNNTIDDKIDNHDWEDVDFWDDSTWLPHTTNAANNTYDEDLPFDRSEDVTFDRSTITAIHSKYAEYLTSSEPNSSSEINDFWVIKFTCNIFIFLFESII